MALFRLKLCLELASAPAHQRFEQQKYTHAEQISKEKKFLDFEELDELFSLERLLALGEEAVCIKKEADVQTESRQCKDVENNGVLLL